MPHASGDIEDEQVREIFAYFGLAAYHAQCFEVSLGIVLLLDKRISDATLTLKDLDALEASLQKKTLGNLLKDFRRYITLDTEYESMLETALGRRNFLIHHFFWDRAVHFTTEAGRKIMRDELIGIDNDLQRAEALMVAMYTALSRALGITDDILEEALAELKAEADMHGS